MVKTWTSEEKDDVTCPKCQSVYAITVHRFPAKDNDSFRCQVCGELLREWNSTFAPEFTLKKRETGAP
jgi:predicted Zn finger-like uncharacterized protein